MADEVEDDDNRFQIQDISAKLEGPIMKNRRRKFNYSCAQT